MKRAVKMMLAAAAFSVLLSSAVYAGEWKQDNGGWRWQEDDGSYARDGWRWWMEMVMERRSAIISIQMAIWLKIRYAKVPVDKTDAGYREDRFRHSRQP